MVEFSLPTNSKPVSGKVFEAPSGATNIKKFMIYRYDPDKNDNPRIDTFLVDLKGSREHLSLLGNNYHLEHFEAAYMLD